MTGETPLWRGAIDSAPVVPEVRAHIGTLSTTRGDVEVFQTNDPYGQGRYMFVAVVHGEPAMFIQWKPESADIRRVDVLWARPDMRYQAARDGEWSLPDQVGRWFFDNKLLTDHSPDRTVKGDSWARKVGGALPPLRAEGHRDPKATEKTSMAVYDLLCQVDWESFLPDPKAPRKLGEKK